MLVASLVLIPAVEKVGWTVAMRVAWTGRPLVGSMVEPKDETKAAWRVGRKVDM